MAAAACRVALALILHVNAVFFLDVLLCHAHLNDDEIHIVDLVHTILKNHLSGMQQRHAQLAPCFVGVPVAVPFHQEDVAPLNGCDTLVHVVEHFKGQSVCFVSQEILQCLCQVFMLLFSGRHLGHGKAAVNLRFHQLCNDVSHPCCLGRPSATLCAGNLVDLPRPVVKGCSLVHPNKFVCHGCAVFPQSLLPAVQLCHALLGLLSLFLFSGQNLTSFQNFRLLMAFSFFC